jgi:hypothetical protein
MAKTKISEYDATAANNTDIDGVNIAESCPPSGINNAIREVMAHLKDFQQGTTGDDLTIAGTLDVTGNLTLDNSSGTSGQVLLSAGSGSTPTWGNAFVSGMIMMWSGSIATIPTGWVLCDGTNSTPDLRNSFVIGAGDTYSVDGTGGSADTVIPSHTHTGSISASYNYIDKVKYLKQPPSVPDFSGSKELNVNYNGTYHTAYVTGRDDGGGRSFVVRGTTGTLTDSFTTASTGVSATGANIPPYYALAYIMKT